MSEFAAEFIGTMILVLLGDGVVANVCLKGTKGNAGGWIVITMGWGLGVFTAVVVSGEFSGAHLNPAVTIALAAAGTFAAAKIPLFLAAQFLGGAAGAAGVAVLQGPLRRQHRPGRDPRHILHRAGDCQPHSQSAMRSDRHVRPGPGGAVYRGSEDHIDERRDQGGHGCSGGPAGRARRGWNRICPSVERPATRSIPPATWGRG